MLKYAPVRDYRGLVGGQKRAATGITMLQLCTPLEDWSIAFTLPTTSSPQAVDTIDKFTTQRVHTSRLMVRNPPFNNLVVKIHNPLVLTFAHTNPFMVQAHRTASTDLDIPQGL